MLPKAVVQQLSDHQERLVEAVDAFFRTHDFCSVIDRAVTLRFSSSAAKLSLYSPRMMASALSKFSDAALPDSKRLILVDDDLGDSHARSKCFMTQAMADAQVWCHLDVL